MVAVITPSAASRGVGLGGHEELRATNTSGSDTEILSLGVNADACVADLNCDGTLSGVRSCHENACEERPMARDCKRILDSRAVPDRSR